MTRLARHRVFSEVPDAEVERSLVPGEIALRPTAVTAEVSVGAAELEPVRFTATAVPELTRHQAHGELSSRRHPEHVLKEAVRD